MKNGNEMKIETEIEIRIYSLVSIGRKVMLDWVEASVLGRERFVRFVIFRFQLFLKLALNFHKEL